ncbi:SDR family NAD(P)-dependent oxidoreductase [Nonomuraea sp. NPDC026600]|uniref:SDR family NAD(P)-dependent oxidoreductase n=1 Tax=Nonomuraea sp. NPDC026600 TaxID=3155363 RepID=UPI0033E48625
MTMTPAMTKDHWKGRHVAITGGTSGIGLATTRLLLSAGAAVTAIGLPDDDHDRLQHDASERLVVATGDVTDPNSLHAALNTGRERHGTIGALITCAGIVRPAYFEDLTDEDHRRHMEVNYFGTLHAIRQSLPDLRQASRATITCISSAAGFVGVFGYGAYCPTKFAVAGLGEVLRQELRPHGITVTIVYPPDVDTPMLAKESPHKPPELRALSGGERALTPEAVAGALLAGTVAGRARVIPDAGTRALRLAAGATPGVLSRYMDRVIRRARRTASAARQPSAKR